jgi:hypothetical protein
MEEESRLARITLTFYDPAAFDYHYSVDTSRIEASEIPDLLRRAAQFLVENADETARWLETPGEDGPRVIVQGTVSVAGLERDPSGSPDRATREPGGAG